MKSGRIDCLLRRVWSFTQRKNRGRDAKVSHTDAHIFYIFYKGEKEDTTGSINLPDNVTPNHECILQYRLNKNLEWHNSVGNRVKNSVP